MKISHLLLPFLLSVLPVLAIERSLTLTAPAAVKPGENIHVVVAADTAATDGEQIGFFQAEYSSDGGKTWVPVYAEKVGRAHSRAIDFKAGAAGSPAMVRARMAFRGGKSGDVDFAGQPLDWGGTWTKWATPPAKSVSIAVK